MALKIHKMEELRQLHAEIDARRRSQRAKQPEWTTPGDLAKLVDPTSVQTPALDVVDQAITWAYETPGARLIISLPPQEGKALALDTPIATPGGWTTMGEIQVGDQVFDRHGKPCNVTWVSPIWHDRTCYTVRTGDGDAIVADTAHEWVARLDRRCGERICETSLLAKARSKNAQIIGASGLELPTADLLLDPYVLGAWLGDGHTKGAMFTCADMEIVERIRAAGVPCRKSVAKYAWSLSPEGWNGVRGNPSPVKRALRQLGVLGDKHIPDVYMRSSTEQRLALLQGLVDTDGYVDPRGQVEFCSISERLANDVRELVFTLGAKATIHAGRATINGKDCGPKYRVRFFMKDAAYLPRKAVRCADSSVARVRYVWAEPAESVPTRCIEVDSPDHTYLAGRSLLPTHNSSRVTKIGSLWALAKNPELRLGIVSYSQPLAEGFGRDVRNWIATFNGDEGSFDVGLRIARDYGSAKRWQLDGHRGGIVCVGIGGGLTGRPLDALVIDDPFSDKAQADSAYYRERVWGWWQAVGSTRLAPGAPVIVILTRWHEDDIAGRFLAAEDADRWRVVNIPALADHDPAKGESDPLGRAPGEWLISARGRTVAEWEQIRIQVGSRVFNALYQGRPSPDAGNVWQRSWWRRYSVPLWSQHPTVPDAYTVAECDEMVMSWDMAFKDTKSSDYVVGQVWARRGANVYLLDQVHKRLSFTDTVTAFQGMVARWPQATRKLVEDKANGTAIIDTLRSKIPGIVAVTPTESKYARANAVAPVVEAGNVMLPEAGIALFDPESLIDEAAAFPNGAHDDQVDATSQALAQMMLDGTGAQAWIDYVRRKVEANAAAAQQAAAQTTQPEPTPNEDPAEARRRARQAAYRQQYR